MSGYREHGFDPNAFEQAGAPLRPFNKVQWAGVVLGSIGFLLSLVDVAAALRWLPQRFDIPSPIAFVLLISGVVLVNSRRDPGTQVGTEQLRRNRRLLIITVAIVAIILGAATVIQFTGA